MTVATANLFEGLVPGAKPAGAGAAALTAGGAPAAKAADGAPSFDVAMANAMAQAAAGLAAGQPAAAAALGSPGAAPSDNPSGPGDDASAAALLLLAGNGQATPLPPAFPPAAAAAERALQAAADKGASKATQVDAATAVAVALATETAALATETVATPPTVVFASPQDKPGATVILPSATAAPPALGLGETPPQPAGLPITPAEVTTPVANHALVASDAAMAAKDAVPGTAQAAANGRSGAQASEPGPAPQSTAASASIPARPEAAIVVTPVRASGAEAKVPPAMSGPLAGELVVAASESAPALPATAAAGEAPRAGRARTPSPAPSASSSTNGAPSPAPPPAATTSPSPLAVAASAAGASDSGTAAPDSETGAGAVAALSDLAERGPSKGREPKADSASQAATPAAAARTGGAQHALLRGAEAAARPHHAPAPPVVDQIVVHLRTAIRNGTDRLDIQLKPAALGHITMKLDMGPDGRVSAVITADRPETLHLLQRDARGLERALQDAGLQTNQGSLSFNLRGEGQGAGQHYDPTGGFGSGFAQPDAGLDLDPGGDSGTETESAPPARPRAAADRALDIEV